MVNRLSTHKNDNRVEKIFQSIMVAHGFTQWVELARHLNVSKQTLLNWRKRNRIADYEVFTRCGYSEEWARTGEGDMCKSPEPPRGDLVRLVEKEIWEISDRLEVNEELRVEIFRDFFKSIAEARRKLEEHGL